MANLLPVTLDLETFWSTEHTLSKMNPIVYCQHPETELISISAKFGEHATDTIFGENEIVRSLKKIDWSDKIVVGHNMSGFDAMILAWRCGVRPRMWACTLAMARPHHAKTTGLSLGRLVEHYAAELTAMGVSAVKDQTALINTKGRHLKDFTPAEIEAMGVYNKTDVEQCYGLFKILYPLTGKREMRLIDSTIRMLVEPQFEADIDMLQATLEAEQVRKQKMLVDIGKRAGAYWPGMDDWEVAEAAKTTLASAPKFAEFLRSLDVEPPMKPSPSDPAKMIPALAKTDQAFLDLQEHDNELVALAAAARLGVKSTQLETRTQSFINVARACDGKMPVAMNYYGADTTGRDSGAFGLNQQNLPRVIPGQPKPTDALRRSLRAPEGYKVVVADLSGIELRVNLMLWKVPYAMELYAADPEADLYKPLASEVLGVPIEGMPKMVRQAGKAMHLGCGFGLGTPSKYVAVAKQMAQISVTPEEAAIHIEGYRRKHPEVVEGWRTCHTSLTHVFTGSEFQIDPWGFCQTTPQGIRTPRGMIYYPSLRREANDGKTEWVYGTGSRKARIYAGKVDENIVQHLARNVLMDNLLEIRRQTGYNAVLRVHDELVYIAPDSEAEALLDTIQGIMRTPPTWWPELVTWSEGDIAQTYGDAK